jgi:hypothetical protein
MTLFGIDLSEINGIFEKDEGWLSQGLVKTAVGFLLARLQDVTTQQLTWCLAGR